ncbi:MAG: hypothetical protein HDS16_00955 [Bacteroides sp.]|nr:hypothetical protein [Bacteroides sp.]
MACHVWETPSVVQCCNNQTWHATSLHFAAALAVATINMARQHSTVPLPDECRDVACHVWETSSVLQRRNNQTWHATSLHFATALHRRNNQT